MSYKAVVYRRGSTRQQFYGKNLEKLHEVAIKALTSWEPGFGETWPERIELFESLRQLSGNRSEWKRLGVTMYKDIPEEKQEWRKKQAIQADKKLKLEKEEEAKRCKCPSPITGQLCTMGKDHAGPHQVGGPYHTIESFVTQCAEGMCDYHTNHTGIPSIVRWQECCFCGHRKPLSTEQYLLETPCGAVELFAVNDNEAISFALKHLAQSRVVALPGVTSKSYTQLSLWRYPKNYVDKPKGVTGESKGLIAVEPFISALSESNKWL